VNREYWQLRTASRNYYDAYRLCTRIGNRLRALARAGEAYDIDLHAQLEAATVMKDTSGRILVRVYKNIAPPRVREFQKATLGIGEVWMARLIGEVGDFVTYTEAWWETPDDARGPLASDDFDDGDDELQRADAPRPKRVLAIGDVRTTGVRELWAYCGHGDPERRRRRGQDQEEALASGNPAAKMIVHQMAEFALRSNGAPDKNGKARGMTPYYPCYLRARAHAQELHEDWIPGHVYTHAVRIVGKAILKDLWRVQHGHEPIYGAHQPEWQPRRPLLPAPPAPRTAIQVPKPAAPKRAKAGARA
jgi:hypothetical protein